jgi:DNA-binding beta-propeller fold protein YncE
MDRDSVFAFNIRQEPAVFADISSATSLRSDTVNLGTRMLQGCFFNPDGTKIFVCENSNLYDFTITETTLSRPWDISSHGSVNHTFTAPSITGTNYNARPQDIYFSPDGKKLYYACVATDKVFYHTLSTAWTLSTVSANAVAEFQTAENSLKSVFFSPDGKYMFVTGFNSDRVRRHTLSTPWDITTATQNQTASVTSIPLGLFFSPHGDRMYIADNGTDSILQWNLSEPWVLTGVNASNYDDELDLTTVDTTPRGLFITPNGRNLYVQGGQNDTIYQYAL